MSGFVKIAAVGGIDPVFVECDVGDIFSGGLLCIIVVRSRRELV